MFGMLPIVGALFLIVLLLLAAYMLVPAKKPEAALSGFAPIHYAPEPLRVRTQYEIETDEDLSVIEQVYRDDRRAKRAQMALERLSAITPAAAAPSGSRK